MKSVQQNAFKSFLEPYMETEGSKHTSIPSLFDDRIIDLTESILFMDDPANWTTNQ